jgi:hypothetical protein
MTDADYLMNLPPLIPREVIFGNPERADAKVSPDGTRMAYLAPDEGVLNVWVGEVGGDDYHPVTRDRDRGVRIYFWAHDGEHLLYLQDVGGDENWRLHKVHLASGTVEDLTPFENVQVQIAAHDKRHPDELLVAMNKEDERLHDIYRLDLTSGRLELVVKNPGNVMGWVADADHRVRAALAATAERRRTEGRSCWCATTRRANGVASSRGALMMRSRALPMASRWTVSRSTWWTRGTATRPGSSAWGSPPARSTYSPRTPSTT